MPKLYAILRFEKRHKGSIAKIGNHHERTKEHYKSNPDINRERSSLNYHLKEPAGTYTQMVAKRLAEAKCRVRKDSVLLADTFIGGTPEFINGLSAEEQKEYFKRGYDFIAENIGEHNILSAVVHMDEKTPHMHLVFTPMTADNRLTAKEVLGNPQKFEKWQNDFYECMSERWNCLERGASAKETGRKHIPIRLFKQSEKLNDDVNVIRELLDDMSFLNINKNRTKVLEMLDKWYRGANSFSGQLKYQLSSNKALQAENTELVQELRQTKDNFAQRINEKDVLINETMEDYRGLISRNNANVDFINFIPDDLYNELERRYHFQKRAEKQAEYEDGYEMDDDD